MAGERALPGVGLKAGWTLGSNGYGPDIERNFQTISAILQGKVKSRNAALPASPTVGDIYIVKSDDGTNPNKIAIWDSYNGGALAWQYLTPQAGWSIYIADEGANVVWNGTAWRPQGGYDISTFVSGSFLASESVQRHVAARAFNIPASLSGTTVAAMVATTATFALSVKKNGTSFGTITFNSNGSIALSGSSTNFAAGDVLSIEAPATPDTTLSNVSITLKGKLV
jgi:hypothetical protein